MQLRPALMPPVLDEAKVARLANLATLIDESGEPTDIVEASLAEFNREAGTELEFDEFQGVNGAMDYDRWVRGVLSATAVRAIPDIAYDELLELLTRVRGHDGAAHEVDFWFELLRQNVPDLNLSDLIYHPDKYFGDGHRRELSSREILDIALATPKVRFHLPPVR